MAGSSAAQYAFSTALVAHKVLPEVTDMATSDKPAATVEVDPVLAAAQAQIADLQEAASVAAGADDVLIQALTPWLGGMHVGINARAAHDVLTWMSARGY